jgi:hypothetical protein
MSLNLCARWSHAGILLLVMALSFIPAMPVGGEEASTVPQDFHDFWNHFRNSVLDGNKEQVAALTLFPFKTRGMLDSDPIRLHDRSSFKGLFEKLVTQDTGLRKEPEPMRDLIQRTDFINATRAKNTTSTERVGNFVFERVNNRWLFVMAYLDEE